MASHRVSCVVISAMHSITFVRVSRREILLREFYLCRELDRGIRI